jgi:primosomal protein N' (replication factor Y)
VGTERLEELLVQRFDAFPVLRIDRSTTRRRDALDKHLTALGNRPGILVGTQILAKGHDLPNLTLVVVVGVDEGLFSADFRAGEKLSQQLIQVAGRAGRARRIGEVWLQTHHPDHPMLHTLIQGGYGAFAESELVQRQAAGFPPFAHMALMRAEASRMEACGAFLQQARAAMEAQQRRQGLEVEVEVQGPIPAPMPRRAGLHRAQLLLTAKRRGVLHALLDAALPAIQSAPEARKVRWSLDVDPLDLY